MSPGKVRAAVVSDKAAVIERMLDGVASLPLASESEFLADPRMVAAGESFLRRALEALFDVGHHLLAKGFGEPATEYQEIARRLRERSILNAGQVERLTAMAGYRNRLVHFYDEVSPEKLYSILKERSGDIRILMDALRTWLAAHPDRVDESL